MEPAAVDWTALLNHSAHLGLDAFLTVFAARIIAKALRLLGGMK